MKNKKYRNGAIGALMDEYEKAVSEFSSLLNRIPQKEQNQKFNQTATDEFHSFRDIVEHVIDSGYIYSNYIREVFGIKPSNTNYQLKANEVITDSLREMIQHTLETLDQKWELDDEKISKTIIKTGWGTTYDLEQLLEHAIVHILRHRRQIEKILAL